MGFSIRYALAWPSGPECPNLPEMNGMYRPHCQVVGAAKVSRVKMIVAGTFGVTCLALNQSCQELRVTLCCSRACHVLLVKGFNTYDGMRSITQRERRASNTIDPLILYTRSEIFVSTFLVWSPSSCERRLGLRFCPVAPFFSPKKESSSRKFWHLSCPSILPPHLRQQPSPGHSQIAATTTRELRDGKLGTTTNN